jgi:hypothetical protein
MYVSALSDLKPSQLRLVEDIYLDSFPADERMPFEEIVSDVWESRRIAYVALDEDTVLGFTSSFILKSVNVLYLEYMAINRSQRGGGLGSELWHHLRVDARTNHGGMSGIILEVEDPDEPDIGPDEVAQRRRRIGFYTGRSASTLPVADYRVPCLQGEGDRPMLLMWASTGRPTPTGRDHLVELVRALYLEGYDLPPSHPLVIAASAK